MATAALTLEVEEFWESLLPLVEDKQVIPVVGAEILNVNIDGIRTPLYLAVAERLLTAYGLSLTELPEGEVVQPHHELYDAVRIVAAFGRRRDRRPVRINDLYRQINDFLRELLATQQEILEPLRQLASIRDFDLFATTTPDDLLARALNAVRFQGARQTEEIEYAPKLPTNRRSDIPEVPERVRSDYAAVFYLFGKADPSPFFAIHDEDALEFAYTLQAGNGPERIFSQLRNRSLLFIGCNFADWLSRLFIRLSNSDRLSSDRTKKEFLTDSNTIRDRDLTVFLERFSQDSRFFPMDASAFMADLFRRWSLRNPTTAATTAGHDAVPTGGDIFISYSSDDVGAAKQLFEDLQSIGAGVAWFDKSALKPGDNWDQQLLSAVQRCSFFLPLLSANTERRTEGYFRLEWDEAAERSRRIQGRKFILPIVIDPDFAGDMGHYRLVPDAFKAFQYSAAPAGRMSDTLKAELTEQLRMLRRAKAA